MNGRKSMLDFWKHNALHFPKPRNFPRCCCWKMRSASHLILFKKNCALPICWERHHIVAELCSHPTVTQVTSTFSNAVKAYLDWDRNEYCLHSHARNYVVLFVIHVGHVSSGQLWRRDWSETKRKSNAWHSVTTGCRSVSYLHIAQDRYLRNLSSVCIVKQAFSQTHRKKSNKTLAFVDPLSFFELMSKKTFFK